MSAMTETLKTIVLIEWGIVGVLFFNGIRKWNKRLSDLLEELKEQDEESTA